jgi:hypothetical protein
MIEKDFKVLLKGIYRILKGDYGKSKIAFPIDKISLEIESL